MNLTKSSRSNRVYNIGHLPHAEVAELLNEKYIQFSSPEFIESDPICIPRRYSKLQDIEITAFWTAVLSWGQRRTIIAKAEQLFGLMDNDPHQFVLHHSPQELRKFENYVHRTFQPADTLYFIHFLKHHYSRHDSLEDAFFYNGPDVESALIHFRNYFFSLDAHLKRTEKHLSSPVSKSACKRMNMFLRWMVRSRQEGIDFGLWKKTDPSRLFIPFDVHVERVSRNLGLLNGKTGGWKSVVELTEQLRHLDPADPVKYDFALFGMGVMEGKGQNANN